MMGLDAKLFLLLLATTVSGFGVDPGTSNDHDGSMDGNFESLVEEFILARDVADEELRYFYENAPPGMKPDPHTEAQERVNELREQLKNAGLSDEDLNDILRIEEEGQQEIQSSLDDGSHPKKRAIEKSEGRRWTKGIITYVLTNETSTDGRIQIERAMHIYERFTCMRFHPWENIDGVTTNDRLELGHPGHLKFVSRGGCWSYVGNLKSSGGQAISCCGWTACMHEIGHAIGFSHEQQTPNPDRDLIIRMNLHYQSSSGKQWYTARSPTSVLSYGYDISSYMHYAQWMFSANGGDTFSYLIPGVTESTGSYYLMRATSVSHKCDELHCADLMSTVTCDNDGYLTLVDNKCGCRCLPGLDPATGCTTIYKQDPADLTLPPGKYALPAAASGCPDGSFTEGSRTHYNEGGSSQSNPYDLKGSVTDKTVEQHFCVSESEATDDHKWPNGNYCIYRKGGSCPDGFNEGFVQYDDKKEDPMTNKKSGVLPDGVFDNNTRFEFCCQRHSFIQDELFLPSRQPLVLMKHPDEGCQKIRGMHISSQHAKVDNSNEEGIAEKGGDNPIYKVSDAGAYWTGYCYYKPAMIDCGDVIELDTNNPTVTISSPPASELECYWLIKAPKGERVQLDFTSFDVKGYPGDCDDEVEVRFLRPGQRGVTYCGDHMNKTITSFNNTVHIRMSTFGDSGSHFIATAKLVADEDLCYVSDDRGTTYDGEVNFTSEFEPCMPWRDVAHCNYHPYNVGALNTLLTENYCRNPDYKTGFQPWCYTNTECDRGYCDVCLRGNRFDKRDDCSTLKDDGFCDMPGAIGECARTCEEEFPDPEDPIKASEVTCGLPSCVIDGEIVGEDKDTYAVGESVTYQCNYVNNTRQSICLSSGDWSPINFACRECPDNWHVYKGSCYGYFPETVNFPDANAQCSEFGAVLSPHDDEEEAAFIKSISQSSSTVWIGMTDAEVEGVWVNSYGDAVNWTNWDSNQPDNWGSGEDCATTRSNGKWNDLPCNPYRHAFICKIPKQELQNCLDFWDECDDLFAYNPNMCTTHEDFAEQQCAFTCGLCNTDSLTKCQVEAPSVNATTDDQRSEINRGEALTYTCNEGFVPVSGDLVRGCQASGILTGKPVECVPGCPEGWTYRAANQNCYRYFNDTSKVYADAKTTCEGFQGSLVMTKSASELDFVHNLRSQSATIWLGLDDTVDEGTFRWADGSRLLFWDNWNRYEPNDWGSGEDCGTMTNNKEWNDISCTTSFYFVCQVPLKNM